MSRYETIGTITSPVAQALTRLSGGPAAYVVDLSKTSSAEIAKRADLTRPVVMLNATSDRMAPVVGIGVDCQGAVWHPGKGKRPDEVLFVPTAEGDLANAELRQQPVEKPEQGAGEPSGEVTVGTDPFEPMRDIDIAAELDGAVRHPLLAGKTGAEIDPIPDGVAGKQVLLSPTRPFTYHPKSYTWKHDKKPVVIKDQTATLSLPVFAEIYASPSPANKFLRVTAYGTGFSPGNLKWNADLERGMYQDRLRTAFRLGNTPGGTTILTSLPKTQNNQATYTSAASLTVGLKGGKEGPEPSGSVTISSSVSSTLSDFKALEKSAGLVGEWGFDMQLCGSKSDSTYDVNKPLSLCNFWGTVLDVPGLAKSTLFPACMAAWALPLNCQSNVPLTVEMFQQLRYVASNRIKMMAAGCHITKPFMFSVDFGAVNIPQGALSVTTA